MHQLPVSMEEIVDLLNDVNQQLDENDNAVGEVNDNVKEESKGPVHSSPAQPTEASAMISHIKFSPNKSLLSPTKRHMVSVTLRVQVNVFVACVCVWFFFFLVLF